ncbi:hypothetical protein [uncultured Pseudokineococcus sp.]|uniref:hypothetical protein n=1 Tax=uncultured Pseudokineococcus sp. TaxID=1642928 RepID=UPI00262ABF8C|nr:hypothetical protein [uncultured Pseudokineococcus sp.]
MAADGGPGTRALGALTAPDDDLRAWARLAPLGLVLLGAGTCVTGDAAVGRGTGASRRRWVLGGTVGLLLQGAGLSVFGEAVKRRALHDVRTSSAAGAA